MPVTLAKTWTAQRIAAADVYENSATQRKTFLLGVKLAFVASGHWVVQSSSDATARGDFSGDSWTEVADLVCAVPGSNHSWIVLRNAAIGATFDVCFDLQTASERSFGVYACTDGYNLDGTRTARPTAVGTEVTVAASTSEALASVALIDGVVLTSSDGHCTRVLAYGDSYAYSRPWIFDRLDNAPSWLTVPWLACVPTAGTTAAYAPSYDTRYCSLTTGTQLVSSLGATAIAVSAASIGAADQYGTAAFEGATTYNEDHYLAPVALVSRTAAVPGLLGTLADAYWLSDAWTSACVSGGDFQVNFAWRTLHYLPALIGATPAPRGLALLGAWALGSDGAIH